MEIRMSGSLRIAGAVAAVLVVTVLFAVVTTTASAIFNATTVGFAYLIVVLLVAARWGIVESVVASVIATILFNYFFLPPLGTWRIADPENWTALFAFLITSLIASDLSNRARRRTAEANTRKLEMERLYELSRAVLTTNIDVIGDQVAKDLARIFQIPAVAIYDRISGSIYRAGTEEMPDIEVRLKEAGRTGSPARDEKTGTTFAAMNLGGMTTGSIAIRGAEVSNAALHALLNLIAITLENARSREILTRADAARQSEEFKSTLLDGLAHEFKTPLTSIKAATSALLASNVSDAAQQQELLTIVDQEAERLSRLVTEAMRVARIEAGKIQMNRHSQSATRLIQAVVEQMEPQLDGRTLDVAVAQDMPPVFVDADLFQLALRQLVDNALKYSPRLSSIRITADVVGRNVMIAVRNQCEPLSDSEQTRLFDKFYRGRNVRHQVAGTGMGLPVARHILLAHGGDLRLHSSDESGTEFVMRFPISEGQR